MSGLLEWTGHPFVDAGLAAILLLSDKKDPSELTEENIHGVIEKASRIYEKDEFLSAIHGNVLPNNRILMASPSLKGKASAENISRNLQELFHHVKNSHQYKQDPKCIVCGKRTAYYVYAAKKDEGVFRNYFTFLGSGNVTNFFPSGNSRGADICAHCIFLVHFMPLVCYQLQSRLLLIHAYPYKLMIELARDAVNDAKIRQLVSQPEGFERPEHYLISKMIEIGINLTLEMKDEWRNASITLYHFKCGNETQRQIISIIRVPPSVIGFLLCALSIDEAGWRRILGGKHAVEISQKLIGEENILRYFYYGRSVQVTWELVKCYIREVLGMDENYLKGIEAIGERVVETLEKLPTNKIAKRVRELERAERLEEFFMFFKRLEKDRQECGLEGPLIRISDKNVKKVLTEYEEVSWRVSKDLLLFIIYERLHDQLTKEGEIEEEEEILEEE